MSLQSEVMRLWEMGQYDTAHIAEILGASEATVYLITSSRPRAPKRAAPKAPYAGYETYYPNRFVRSDVPLAAGEP
jgi:hypothetical protein